MSNICVTSPFPTYTSIRSSIDGLFINPLANVSIPYTFEMPTIPSPIFPSIGTPNLQLSMFVNELMTNQMLALIGYVYDKLSSIVSIPFPKIPSLDIDLTDLLSVQPRKFITAIEEKFKQVGDWSFIPMVPDPLFPSISMPEFESLSAFQIAVSAYLSDLATMLFNMVNSIADKFQLPGMPEIPKLPSKEEILALVPDMSLEGLKGISFPGFSFTLDMPDPLIPNMGFPRYEFIEGYKTVLTSLAMENIKKITDFITNTLQISLSLPEVCAPVVA